MPTELLTPFYWSIGTLFKYRFRVPVYQRPYSWTTTEVNSLIDDIMNSYIAYKNMPEEQQQVYSFYVGNIILHKKEHELYDIIDGQQRITTFSLILLACYTRLNELDVDPNDRILINIQSSLWKLNNEERPVLNRRVIELGSIDKQSLIEVFNAAYSQPKELKQFIKKI